VSGDFNGDGAVNGSDFVLWQRGYGSTGIDLAADANGDGRVDTDDLNIWQTNFGRVGGVALSVVPEPGGQFFFYP
jgi:uncharacterized protein (DUF2141 family)